MFIINIRGKATFTLPAMLEHRRKGSYQRNVNMKSFDLSTGYITQNMVENINLASKTKRSMILINTNSKCVPVMHTKLLELKQFYGSMAQSSGYER